MSVGLTVGSSLLGLLGVVVLLEVLLSHFALNYHQAGVDERLLEELALEHSNQVFDSNILARRALNHATVCRNLLLLGQGLLRSVSCLLKGLEV